MSCDQTNDKSKVMLVLLAGAGGVTTVYILSQKGLVEIEGALVSGLIVGGLLAGGYYLYECNFNIFQCAGSSVWSGLCGIEGTIESAWKALFGS